MHFLLYKTFYLMSLNSLILYRCLKRSLIRFVAVCRLSYYDVCHQLWRFLVYRVCRSIKFILFSWHCFFKCWCQTIFTAVFLLLFFGAVTILLDAVTVSPVLLYSCSFFSAVTMLLDTVTVWPLLLYSCLFFRCC